MNSMHKKEDDDPFSYFVLLWQLNQEIMTGWVCSMDGEARNACRMLAGKSFGK
jgi:hypothetical protein